jgi:hypothetical protein
VLNLSLTVLQFVPPLCDYKMWIDTDKNAKVKRYLRSMVELNVTSNSSITTARFRASEFIFANSLPKLTI